MTADKQPKAKLVGEFEYVALPPTSDEVELLASDVKGELLMLNAALEITLRSAPPADQWEHATRLALAESFLMHARNLTDFFGSEPTGDDVTARHYADWNPLADGGPELAALQKFIPTMNKRIVHITAYRVRRPLKDDPYYFEVLAKHLNIVWERFWSRLSSEQRDSFDRVPIER